jgi:hypothetical protein
MTRKILIAMLIVNTLTAFILFGRFIIMDGRAVPCRCE